MDENQNETTPETQEQTPPQAENTGQTLANKDFDSEISSKASNLRKEHGDKFNETGFKEAAQKHIEKHGNLDSFDGNNFVNKDKQDNECNNGDGGKKYLGGWEDGKFVWKGPDGERIEGKDFAEAEDKICAVFAKNAKEKGTEGKIFSYWPSKTSLEQKATSSRMAIKHGLMIGAGWSEDKQVWQDLKADYMKDPNHNIKDWERMTRKIPDDVMSRTPEERERNKKLNDTELLGKLRQGKNPNLTDASKPATTVRPNTNNNINTERPTTKPKGNDGY